MKIIKENKGITLIALIITIIVMLILVGVTVNVALNGGLFKKAQEAVEKTQIEMDREVLQEGILAALDKDLRINTAENLQNNLPEGWIVTGNDGGQYRATSPKNNIFPVDDDGTIHDPIAARKSTELERYLYGEEGLGRDYAEIFNMDFDNPCFTDDSLNVEYIGSAVRIFNNNGEADDVYIKYEDKVYKFQVNMNWDEDSYTTDIIEGTKLLYEPEEGTNVGKYVQYDNRNWVVLYDDYTNGLQMISLDILDERGGFYSLTDGIDESKVEDIDKDNLISDVEKAIYSYNNIVEILNKRCENLVIDKSKVAIDTEGNYKIRSAGSSPTGTYVENNKPYVSNTLERINPIYNGKGYGPDCIYESDFARIFFLKLQFSGTRFLMPSRLIREDENYVAFNLTFGCTDGVADVDGYMWSIDEYGVYGVCTYSGEMHGFCPVITLNPNALEGLSGEGTADEPLVLE